jgi:hypothetical protein
LEDNRNYYHIIFIRKGYTGFNETFENSHAHNFYFHIFPREKNINSILEPGAVVHTCDPSYVEGVT